MTKSSNLMLFSKNVWNNQKVKLRYKRKFRFYKKLSYLSSLKVKFKNFKKLRLKSSKQFYFSRWTFLHRSLLPKVTFQQDFLMSFRGNFIKLLSIDGLTFSNIFSINFFNSVFFSSFLISILQSSLSALNFYSKTNEIFSGWFLIFRLIFFRGDFKKEHFPSSFYEVINNKFFFFFEKYYRFFFSSLRNKQWIYFSNKNYWSLLTIPRKLLAFSLYCLISWKALHGSSKKVWMALSNAYCAFYFYKHDIVVFNPGKTIHSLKKSFHFLAASVQRGSHIVFISWRFSDEFKTHFYDTIKRCLQSGSYGWYGGVLTNIKKLGLFSNVYFKNAGLQNVSEALLKHSWLKLPSLINNSNYFSVKNNRFYSDVFFNKVINVENFYNGFIFNELEQDTFFTKLKKLNFFNELEKKFNFFKQGFSHIPQLKSNPFFQYLHHFLHCCIIFFLKFLSKNGIMFFVFCIKMH